MPRLASVPAVASTLLLTASLALAQSGAPSRGAAVAPAPVVLRTPTLVVFITVDQLRPDYLTRFGGQFTGGLARLLRGGAVFTDGYQDHATTETAPGHAATMSGRFPRSTGIVMNAAGVQDPQAPLIGAGGPGASPFRFRGSALIDWMRVKDPRSRALSVSRKDRGAILPLGRAKQPVFWFTPAGRFTTSSYYADTLPTWVNAMNARRVPQNRAGTAWTLLLPDSAYPEADSVPIESGGRGIVFPHVLPSDTALAIQSFYEFPWMDELTLQFALQGLNELRLGAGPQTDLLAVSLSTTDAVGHRYGPDSRELHDQILRLDRYLGAFFDSLFTLRDSSSVVVALTADHGVAPYPEVRSRDPNRGAKRVYLEPLAAAELTALASRGVGSNALWFGDGVVYVDRGAFRAAHVNADSAIAAFAASVRRVPGVLRADAWSALARADTVHDAIARRWLHMFPSDLPVGMVITLSPYSYFGNPGWAEHGSPHDYDSHVPIIFLGPWFRPGRYPGMVRVVDMAPTLAAVLGVAPTERLDGRVLRQALR